jgi:hypothetical protein
MASALEAGLHGDTTAATELLALDDATQKLDRTTATRSLPATRAPRRAAQTAVRPPAAERRPARRRTNPLRWIILALIVLLAGVLIALALTLGGGNRQDISNGNVDDQVRDLIQYVNDHTK